jgi:hypothetical protein
LQVQVFVVVDGEEFAMQVWQMPWALQVWQVKWHWVQPPPGVPVNPEAHWQLFPLSTSFVLQDKQLLLKPPLQVRHVEWQVWQMPCESA